MTGPSPMNHQIVTAPAAAGNMSLPGLEHNVDVFVSVEPADHHEVVAPFGADKRRNQGRIEVAAKRHHMHAGAGHVAPGGDHGRDSSRCR